jgi:hypothetical protein
MGEALRLDITTEQKPKALQYCYIYTSLLRTI